MQKQQPKQKYKITSIDFSSNQYNPFIIHRATSRTLNPKVQSTQNNQSQTKLKQIQKLKKFAATFGLQVLDEKNKAFQVNHAKMSQRFNKIFGIFKSVDDNLSKQKQVQENEEEQELTVQQQGLPKYINKSMNGKSHQKQRQHKYQSKHKIRSMNMDSIQDLKKLLKNYEEQDQEIQPSEYMKHSIEKKNTHKRNRKNELINHSKLQILVPTELGSLKVKKKSFHNSNIKRRAQRLTQSIKQLKLQRTKQIQVNKNLIVKSLKEKNRYDKLQLEVNESSNKETFQFLPLLHRNIDVRYSKGIPSIYHFKKENQCFQLNMID